MKNSYNGQAIPAAGKAIGYSGGEMQVRSELGCGSVFEIYLPETDDELVVVAEPVPARRRGNGTVLLVEDEAQLRALTRIILTRAGYKVIEADNGESALAVIEAHRQSIDLLLTDVVMPKMGGRELAERIREARPDVRTLFMSGYTGDTIVRHGVVEADVAFLQKPIRPEVLLDKVDEVLA